MEFRLRGVGCRLELDIVLGSDFTSKVHFCYSGIFFVFVDKQRRRSKTEQNDDSDRNETSVGTRFFSKLLLSAEKGPRLFRSRVWFRFRCGVTYRVASIPGNFPSLLPEQPQDLLSGDESDARFVRDKTFGKKIIFVAASASDKFCLDKR